jgi:hypothetical protein
MGGGIAASKAVKIRTYLFDEEPCIAKQLHDNLLCEFERRRSNHCEGECNAVNESRGGSSVRRGRTYSP